MPPTTVSSKPRTSVDRVVVEKEFSGITAGETFAFTWTAAEGPLRAPYKMWYTVTTQPTGRFAVTFAWTSNNNVDEVLSSRTCNVVLDTEAGGSLTDAVVRVYAEFLSQASGGIS